jgi:hypothetical protein
MSNLFGLNLEINPFKGKWNHRLKIDIYLNFNYKFILVKPGIRPEK